MVRMNSVTSCYSAWYFFFLFIMGNNKAFPAISQAEK